MEFCGNRFYILFKIIKGITILEFVFQFQSKSFFLKYSKENACSKKLSTKTNALGLHCRSNKEVNTKEQIIQIKTKQQDADNINYTN